MLHRRHCLVLLLAFPMQSCCWQVFTNVAEQRLDDLTDNYMQVLVTSRSCYSRPTELERSQCYFGINALLAPLEDLKDRAVDAFKNCDLVGLENALRAMDNYVAAEVLGFGNMTAVADEIDLQATGSGAGDMATTVTLGNGSTLFLRATAGAPVAGPMALAGSFVVSLAAQGSLRIGPVTALSITGTNASYPTWQLTLQPSPQNLCILNAPVGGIRSGELTAAMRLTSGNLRWTLVVKLPVRATDDLASWTISTGTGLVPADRFFPRAPGASPRLRPGCSGSNGSVPGMRLLTVPRVGDSLVLKLALARPSMPAALCIGDSSTTWNGLPLPIDLGIINAPTCFLRASALLLVPVTTDQTGQARFTVPVPNDAGLAMSRTFQQWIVVDPPANGLGVVVSDAIGTTFFAR
jgi:hypothetical protein